MAYVGRFAPSPSGPLHFGSLLTAVASYLQARSQQGQWLLRIEDIDKPRTVAGASDSIIRTLAAYGFEWDGEIVFQSQRLAAYEQALSYLKPFLYACTCSRRQLAATAPVGNSGIIYPGHCRHRSADSVDPAALRVRVPSEPICFRDHVFGRYCQCLAEEVGDFILKRSDGIIAYQLAVVVDDAWQGVTEIVRGADLLDNTPRQLYLQQLLGLPTPRYLHLPLALNEQGQKLSKNTGAPALPLGQDNIIRQLCRAFIALGQTIQATDINSLSDFWAKAQQCWNPHLIPQQVA